MGIITYYSCLFQRLVMLTIENMCLVYSLNLTGCRLVGVTPFPLSEKVPYHLHFSPYTYLHVVMRSHF